MKMEVRRVFVEKKAGFDIEARRLQSELTGFLGARYPELSALRGLRILNRYDAVHLDEAQFKLATDLVFSEPQCDRVFFCNDVPAEKDDSFFGIEYLSGQYDQRSDSAEQCAELIAVPSDDDISGSAGAKPIIKSARFFILQPGKIPVSAEALSAVKHYLINPVDSREALPALPLSLEDAETTVADVPILEGFTAGAGDGSGGAALQMLAQKYGLAMGLEDIKFCRDYFASIKRDPTLAELRVLDTYWSDHCRHTTFTTALQFDQNQIDQTENNTGDENPGAGLQHAFNLYEEARREVYGAAAKDRKRSLMDMATLGAKVLKKRGLADDVDESEEINACTVKIGAEFGGSTGQGSTEPWLLLFKNETHNHPTEIEPFGGAATCLGGAIRDPLSGRAYVHQAMRITGGGDPRESLDHTLPGKLPQIKIARDAAAGYSSYGNQIGLPTGQVAEFYHPGFLAKRMELGAVIAAVPAKWVRREEPAPGDAVILVGGKTGRDGIGGATGSSKVHTGESVETAGAEVQKGNAVEERKLQRLFRNPVVTALIKRCNDFGAGGVSVAVGELADGLDINLDAVPKKYAGLDGIELAISESQERMAVVVAASDTDAFIRLAAVENLDAVVIAQVTGGNSITNGNPADGGDVPRLRMSWRGKTIVDLSREFLNSNGAPRSAAVSLTAIRSNNNSVNDDSTNSNTVAASAVVLLDKLERELASLRSGSRRGLQERFDGSIGASSVLFPWGGSEQGTPECGIAALLPSLEKQSRTASLMTFGYDPELMEQNPYEGAKGSIREALAKFACLGGDPWKARLTFQEYFERPVSPETWGKPAAALLGALEAQLALGIPAIGGKDSMSGNYRDNAHGVDITVPPTLVAFAAGTVPAASVRSGALSGRPGHEIILLEQSPHDEWSSFKASMDTLAELSAAGLVLSAWPVSAGGVAAALAIMAFGSNTGVETTLDGLMDAIFFARGLYIQGSVLVELATDEDSDLTIRSDARSHFDKRARNVLDKSLASWITIARTIAEPVFRIIVDEKDTAEVPLAVLRRAYEYPLAQVYPQTSTGATAADIPETADTAVSSELINAAAIHTSGAASVSAKSSHSSGRKFAGSSSPLVVLPVFPGTNCEWDMERAFREAGARTRLVIFRNRNQEDIAESTKEIAEAIAEAQIVALSGGFSAGDEPDGSGKFIANVLRSPAIADAITDLLENRDGLMLGICNGFQALIKLGLVPYGRITQALDLRSADTMPTLTFNRIGRHVSRMVRTRVMSKLSPWLAQEETGSLHVIPVSHGEGRLAIRRMEGEALFRSGQVPFCYADATGNPTLAEPDNPNGSDFAIEGLTSPDGRILGKMGHSERRGEFVHINIPGNKRQNIFEAGVSYFV
ncbi:phosphoribosylformylglycinamidine synthase [Spirochaetia bacterium]|nr:phosphoribosylformylglycinamidine synthase [Spirochaetia bacterium]